jgi:Alpha galactosidase A
MLARARILTAIQMMTLAGRFLAATCAGEPAGRHSPNGMEPLEVSRDQNGNIVPDPQCFPAGIKALANYIHARGLKFVYSDAGSKTCAARPGGLGHEYQDALQCLGVDYRSMTDATPPHRMPRRRMRSSAMRSMRRGGRSC